MHSKYLNIFFICISFIFQHHISSLDTSESCNFISPSATREDFTAGIAERVRKIQTSQPLTPKLILNQQQPLNQRTSTTTTTAFFDINSGKISTIVSRPPPSYTNETNGCYFNGNTEKFLTSKTLDLQSPTVVAHANKKPSYLNLACCVNGYSNYTNYDSIERKEINKSREVSPIRPIITMSRQPRSNDNLLSVPTPVTFIKQSPLTSITKRFASLNINSNDKDTTDNAGMMANGVNGGSSNGSVSSRKSFIQQRVEKLYGTTKILTTTTTSTTSSSTKNSEQIQLNGNGTIYHHHNHMNGNSNGTSNGHSEEKENDEELYMNSLPVMKHLRPEFCRQLQFLSPNSPKKVSSSRVNGTNAVIFQNSSSSSSINPPANDKIATETSTTGTSNQVNNLINKEPILEQKEVVMERIVNKDSPVVAESQKSIELSNNNNNINVNNKIEMESELKGKLTTESEVKDGNYFLKLLDSEKTRILKLAEEAEKELEVLQSDVRIFFLFLHIRILKNYIYLSF